MVAIRHTSKEKLEFNRLILKDLLAGLTVKQISKKYGISTASIYKWKREEGQYATQLDGFRNFDIEISEAFAVIASYEHANLWSLRDAIFRIAVWIRWPTEPHTQRAMLITCVSNYLKTRVPSLSLLNLSEDQSKFLYKYLDLEFLCSIATPDAPFFDYFNIVTHGKARYSDLDFYSEIIQYILSSDAMSGLNKKFIKLDRLHYMIENEAFGHGWIMSRRTFQSVWSARAATFPFLYVERFASVEPLIDWNFEPQAPEFCDDIDHIVSNVAQVKKYLSHCRWASEALRSRLHPRAAGHIRFPSFPAKIEAIPLQVKPYDKDEIAKIQAAGG